VGDKHIEWLKQADYDMETADAMYSSGRYLYSVFMCHLSIEKALKGLFHYTLNEVPPKTHNLLYLLNKIEQKPKTEMEKFITRLNTASIATRYPDDLTKIQNEFTEEIAKDIINNSKDILIWVKSQF
jgi:HEPN domain-containing protein